MSIYSILCILILLISLVMEYLFVSRKFDLLYLFSFLWLLILILDSFHAYGMYKASEEFYALMFEGVLFFLIGYYAISLNRKSFKIKLRKNSWYQFSNHVHTFDFVKITTLFIFVSLFTLFIVLTSVTLLNQGIPLNTIRKMYNGTQDNSFFPSSFIVFLHNKIYKPCLFALIPVAVLMFLEHKKIKLAAGILLITVIYSFAIGGRILLLYMLLDLLLIISLYSSMYRKQIENIKKYIKKIKNKVAVFIVLVLVLLVVITVIRGNYQSFGNGGIVRSLYSYLTLNMPLGSYWTDYIENNKIYTCGLSFFSGVLTNINYVLEKIGFYGLFSDRLKDTIDLFELTEHYIDVGKGNRSNAYVTWVFFFYADFRELGVATGSAIFGSVTALISKTAMKAPDLLNCAVYLLFAQSIFKTFVRWEFNQSTYVLAFIYIFLMFKNREEKSFNIYK